MSSPTIPAALLDAVMFAAERHKNQRRKDKEASPYINHPIALAHLLATTGGVEDVATLQAAILHDTIEDTGAKDQPLISHMIASVPEVRFAIEAEAAALEALEIEQALARGREASESTRVGRSDQRL